MNEFNASGQVPDYRGPALIKVIFSATFEISGARKHADYNWTKGVVHRSADAVRLRHLGVGVGEKNIDRESGPDGNQQEL
jgi:hypothetical protein